VEIAKTLFSPHVSGGALGKQIIGFEQYATIRGIEVTLRVDPHMAHTQISEDILKQSGESAVCQVDEETQIRYHAVGTIVGERGLIILGRNDLADVLIDPNVKRPSLVPRDDTPWTSDILDIDQDLHNISKKIRFSSLLRPTNYSQALAEFLRAPHQYNPVFTYAFPDVSMLDTLSGNLEEVQSRIE
jgi:hypothetical protein